MKIKARIPALSFLAVVGVSLGAAALGVACSQEPEGWSPVLEETSTVFLEVEAQRVMGHVENALSSLDSDTRHAQAELQEAESTLEQLLDYYLPLLQAREGAYNAYRRYYMGDGEGVAEDLAGIEDILAEMAGKAEGPRLLEIEALGEEVARTRMAAAAGSEQGREALEGLARRLNQAALKGDLILR